MRAGKSLERRRARGRARGAGGSGAGAGTVWRSPSPPATRAHRFPDRRPAPRDDVATVECSDVTTFQGGGAADGKGWRALAPPSPQPHWSAERWPAGFRALGALLTKRVESTFWEGAFFPINGPCLDSSYPGKN